MLGYLIAAAFFLLLALLFIGHSRAVNEHIRDSARDKWQREPSETFFKPEYIFFAGIGSLGMFIVMLVLALASAGSR